MHGEYINLSDIVFISSADMSTNYYSWEDIFKTEWGNVEREREQDELAKWGIWKLGRDK